MISMFGKHFILYLDLDTEPEDSITPPEARAVKLATISTSVSFILEVAEI